VTERGAGLALPRTATAQEIRTALARQLNEPSYRAAAQTLGDAVAAGLNRPMPPLARASR